MEICPWCEHGGLNHGMLSDTVETVECSVCDYHDVKKVEVEIFDEL